MSHFPLITAEDLNKIATNVSEFKTQLSVKKMCDDIVTSAQEGKFSITICLKTDDTGEPLAEEWAAVEKVKTLFPGIKTTYDNDICTFEWYKTDPPTEEVDQLRDMLVREATQRAETAERKFLKLSAVLNRFPYGCRSNTEIWANYRESMGE